MYDQKFSSMFNRIGPLPAGISHEPVVNGVLIYNPEETGEYLRQGAPVKGVWITDGEKNIFAIGSPSIDHADIAAGLLRQTLTNRVFIPIDWGGCTFVSTTTVENGSRTMDDKKLPQEMLDHLREQVVRLRQK